MKNNVVQMQNAARHTASPNMLEKWRFQLAIMADKQVTNAGKAVSFYLLDRFDETKGYAYPGYTKIMTACAIGRAAAIEAVKSLEAAGWFTVNRTKSSDGSTGGYKTVNRYVPNWHYAKEVGHTSSKIILGNGSNEIRRQSEALDTDCPVRKSDCPNTEIELGSTEIELGAVRKSRLYSTDDYPTDKTTEITTEESAHASEVSDDGRASAPFPFPVISKKAGVRVTEGWQPSAETWRYAVDWEGCENAEEALRRFVEHYDGTLLLDPDTDFKEWFQPF